MTCHHDSKKYPQPRQIKQQRDLSGAASTYDPFTNLLYFFTRIRQKLLENSQVASQVSGWSRIHLPIQELQKPWVRSSGQEDPLEEEMATHSGIPAGIIPWTEQPDGLHAIHRVAKCWT